MKTPRLIITVGVIILILYCASLLWFVCVKNNANKPKNTVLVQTPSVIPLNIFQTWHTKDLPPYMKKCVQTIQDCNPEFQHFLYDDQECRDFISKNFDVDVLYAYDSLIPGAYKADLWRYCVLYKYGGIYIDIKYQCANGFKLIQLTDKEYYVKDREQNRDGIYNAFMICKAGEHIMEKCINQVVENVRNRFYGKSPLDITGPNMMTDLFTKNEVRNLVILYLHNNGKDIIYNGSVILSAYPEYRIEQKQFQKTLYYDYLWKKREVYV
jgi:mannosyltransferase OCH1-like enzyme